MDIYLFFKITAYCFLFKKNLKEIYNKLHIINYCNIHYDILYSLCAKGVRNTPSFKDELTIARTQLHVTSWIALTNQSGGVGM